MDGFVAFVSISAGIVYTALVYYFGYARGYSAALKDEP